MHRFCQSLIVCLLVTMMCCAPTALRADEPKSLSIIASASDTRPTLVRLKQDNSGILVRSAADLAALNPKPDEMSTAELEAEVAKRLQVERIDWAKQMVVIVQGEQTRGEYGTIKFDSLQVVGKNLVTRWRQENRVYRAPNQSAPVGWCLTERAEGVLKSIPQEFTNSLGMKMVLIPAGKFQMGSPRDEPARLDDELQHEVEITQPFYMGRFEVTVGQFKAFVKASGYVTEAEKDNAGGRAFDGKEFVHKPEYNWRNLHYQQKDYEPAVVLSWNDAVACCAWLSKQEGRTYRLPTEAEWEYACRAGSTTRFASGDKDHDLQQSGNIADKSLKAKWPEMFWEMEWDDGHPFTSPMGFFKPNAFGLHDMHGNAWEWCSDWYGEHYYRESPQQDPTGPTTGRERIARGGAWSTQPKFCRSAFRDWHEPTYRSDCVGFRVVVELPK